MATLFYSKITIKQLLIKLLCTQFRFEIMAYKHIFFDLDHTLWDFDTNANETIDSLYDEFKLNDLNLAEFKKEYHIINKQMWLDYELGKINQFTLRYKRFYDTLLNFGIDNLEMSHQLGARYLEHLPSRKALMPGAIEVLEYLNSKYKLHLITNGFDKVQHQKLIHSKIDHYFETVITSEFAGYKKPQKEIFHFAISEVSAFPNNCIMIGDNIDNDIIGASKAGIHQVFYNPENQLVEFTPTYEIRHLIELKNIL